MKLDMSLTEENPSLRPSKFWDAWNEKNADQLVQFGFQNFKRHQALNYFTWGPNEGEQVAFLRRSLPLWAVIRSLPFYPSWAKRWWDVYTWPMAWRFRYCFFVRLLWEYANRHGDTQVLALKEPGIGNPFQVDRNKVISQDLANSSLEVATIGEALALHARPGSPARILELGAGYGRTAYALIGRYNAKYIIVDFPPALLISQEYLTRLFPEKTVFRARKWQDFATVRDEFEAADIAFLLPGQALALPDNCVNLFVSISSLGEMRPDQIQTYFDLADRVTDGVVYIKQWKVSINEPDGIVVNEADYPIPTRWRQLLSRTTPVQTRFFEAAYAVSS